MKNNSVKICPRYQLLIVYNKTLKFHILIINHFLGDSTYGQDFRQWGPEKRTLAKTPAEYKASGIPFDGQSTYKNHFVGDRGGAAVSFKPDSMAYRSHDPFNADTSYRTEYVKKELEKCP